MAAKVLVKEKIGESGVQLLRDAGWSGRTWTGVALLSGVGVAMVATVARHLRARRGQSRSTT